MWGLPNKRRTTMSKEIQSLLAEREGYLRRGRSDRVAQVDDALALLGHRTTESATIQPESERAVIPRATKRKV